MATQVKVPQMGESISFGILAAWHVKDGDQVEKGQHLFDLETDKITAEGTAEVSGVISLKVGEGDEVEIGGVVAEIDESATAPKTESKAEEKKEPEGATKEPDQPTEESKSKSQHRSPPSVQRLAAESGVDPASIEGSGKDGRVTKGDMLAAADGRKDLPQRGEPKDKPEPSASAARTEDASSRAPAAATEARQSRTKMSPLRRTIAKRLVEAQQSTAMLTTFNEVNMEPVMTLRKKHQEAFTKKHQVKLGFMSFFAKATVHALKAVPQVNAQLEDDEIVQNHYFDIGIAVSTKKGLLVPVIRDCDTQNFSEIEKSIIEYAEKAKTGKIGLEDLRGGVFTITNGGVFGSLLSTPILNTPQSAILGMHTIQERAVVEKGEIVIRPMMYLALSYDHRIIDGSEAVTFLVHIKNALEDPARLLLEI